LPQWIEKRPIAISPRIEESRRLNILSAGFFNPREVSFKSVGGFLSVGKNDDFEICTKPVTIQV
jgi:hypothetical protein